MLNLNADSTIFRRRIPFGAMLVANTVSWIGNQITALAIPWFVLVVTGSAAKTGIAAFCELMGYVLGGLVGGPFVDRIGFKHSSMVGDLGAAVTIGAIPLLYDTVGLHFWQLLVLTFVTACFDIFAGNGQMGLVPDLSELAGISLERGNSLVQGIQRLATLIGPIMAGILIAALSAGNVLWFDAFSYIFSCVLIGALVVDRVRDRQQQEQQEKEEAGSEPEDEGGFVTQMAEGWQFIRSSRVLFVLMTIVFFLGFFDSPFFGVVLPVYAKDVLKSSVDLGIMASSLGAGSLIGVLLYGAWGNRVPRWALLYLGLATMPVYFWALGFHPNLIVFCAILGVMSICSGPLNPLAMTIVHERVPPALYGRVFGLLGSVTMLSAPIGVLVIGFAIQHAGLTGTIFVMAALYSLVCLITLVQPSLREMEAIPAVVETVGSPATQDTLAPEPVGAVSGIAPQPDLAKGDHLHVS
ncbi:MAG TPA: MFS transporter [Thermomicrobiaceae bacterium]|nr:MFS transporter [Thermomicrobiaceae bacterium]